MYSSIRSRCCGRVGLAVAPLEAGDDPLEVEHVRAPPPHPVAVLDVDALALGAVQEQVLLVAGEGPARAGRGRSPSGRRSPGSPTRRSSELPTDHGTSAPSAIDSVGSGTSRSGSISCCAPRPVHRGQAPCGELNEKIRGWSSGSETPCSGQANRSEKVSSSPSTTSITTSPSASATAVSIDCASRVRRSAFITSRSTTTSIVCLNFLSRTISSSSSRCSPSTFTRVKPSARRWSKHVLVLALPVADDRCVDGELRPLLEPEHLVDDRLDRLAGDRPPADRAMRPADTCVEQAQVVVDLRHRADRRARVPRGRLLVDRDRRREAVDRVDVRLLHHLQELPRVGGQRLDVAALALRVDRVEGEAGLARARRGR